MTHYLNEQERDELLQDLINTPKFNRVRRKLRRMDPDVRLVTFRNVQNVNEWITKYELPGRGIRVTLIEGLEHEDDKREGFKKPDFALTKVIVEATPDNRT
jgi:hypothetical protein